MAMVKPNSDATFVRALALDAQSASEIESAGLSTELNDTSAVSNSVIGYGLENPFLTSVDFAGPDPPEGFNTSYLPGRSLLMLRTESNANQVRTKSTE